MGGFLSDSKSSRPLPLESRHFAPPSLFEMLRFKQVLFTIAAFVGEIVSSTKRRNPDLRQFSCGQSALQPDIPPDSWIRRGKVNVIFLQTSITHRYYQDTETKGPCGNTFRPAQEQTPVLTINLYRWFRQRRTKEHLPFG